MPSSALHHFRQRLDSPDEPYPASRFNAALFVGFLLWLVWLPMPFGSVEGWARLILHAGAFGLTLVLGIQTWLGQREVNLTAGAVIGLGVIGLALVQRLPVPGVQTVDDFYTRQATVHLLAMVCLFVVSANFFASEKQAVLFAYVFVAWGGLFALYAIMQHFIGQGSYAALRKLLGMPFGTFVNRNHYAGMIELLAPMAVALAAQRRRGTEDDVRWLYVVAAVVMLLSLALCASRGGWIAGAAGTLTAVALAARVQRRWRWAALGSLSLIPLGVLVGVWWMGIDPLVSRLQAPGELPATADQVARNVIWKNTLTLVRERPLTGSGLGTFQIAYTRVDTSNGVNRVEQAHNDYLQLLAETGLVGFALGMAWLGWFFRRVRQGFRRRSEERRATEWATEWTYVHLGTVSGCVAGLVHACFDFNWQIPSNAAYFVVLAALATTTPAPEPLADTPPED
jgi:O-antigen ligase